MRATILLTADFASVDTATGKLNILGAFTRIYAPGFPVRQARMAVVVQIRPDLGDSPDEHTLRVLLTDEDGVDLLQIAGPFRLPHPESGPRPDFNAVLELNGLVFPRPGTYQLTVFADDKELDLIPIEVVKVQQSE